MKQLVRREQGMVLLLVLLVVALLSSLLMELAFSTLVDMRLTETFRDSTRAYYLAEGGVAAGRMLISEDQNAYDSRDESWAQGILGYPVGDGTISVLIEDLDGRLALNALVKGNNPQTVMVDRLYRLLDVLDLEDTDPAELTAAVIDWLDSGDEPYQTIQTDGLDLAVAGAEDDYYQGVSDSQYCKNGPFETLDELALVKGFNADVLKKIGPHVSVNGDIMVNINTATAEVLTSLSADLDAAVVEAVMSKRSSSPIKSISDLEDELSTEAYALVKSLANQKVISLYSSYYRISSEGMVNDGRRRVTAEINKLNDSQLYFKVD
jgi:general secretion pathway protein K